MKSKKFATIKDGVIDLLHDASHAIELKPNQIPLTTNEYYLLQAIDGDTQLGYRILRDVEERIAKLPAPAESETTK